jgi:hypothetical protein
VAGPAIDDGGIVMVLGEARVEVPDPYAFQRNLRAAIEGRIEIRAPARLGAWGRWPEMTDGRVPVPCTGREGPHRPSRAHPVVAGTALAPTAQGGGYPVDVSTGAGRPPGMHRYAAGGGRGDRRHVAAQRRCPHLMRRSAGRLPAHGVQAVDGW